MMLTTISAAFLALSLAGVPIALALGAAATLYIVAVEGLPIDLIIRTMFYSLDSFAFLAIPLFMLMGAICDRSGLLDKLVRWLSLLVGWARAGMAYVSILGNMIISGISGAAVADMASLGPIQMKLMRERGYPNEFAAALNASSAVMGPIIPPSIAMVIYALSAGNISIGGLFVAGILPGVLLGVSLMALSWWKIRKLNVQPIPLPATVSEFATSLLSSTIEVSPLLVLPLVLIGSIVTGIATVTESAAIGVAYVLVVAVYQRRLSIREFARCVIYSGVMTASVGLLIACSQILGYILTRNQITAMLADFMIGLSSDPFVFIALTAVFAFVLGTVLEPNVLIVTLTPLLVPIADAYGINQFHFAMVFILTVEIGLITPPVGTLLFMAATFAKLPLDKLFRAIWPFVFVEMAVVVLVVIFPGLSTWLPEFFGFR